MDANEEGSNLDGDPGMQDGTINISDVIEVIETDMDCNNESTVKMFNGDQQDIQNQVPNMPAHNPDTPYVVITEQPAPKALRFRYECEGRSAGSIPGASSTPENKTYPAIKIVGYKGKAIVVVSCVTKDKPYRPHPHNLVGREGCKKGVCTVDIHNENMTATFSNLGIQCVKKKEIENALNVRQEIRVDPFRTGFQHKNQPTSIDLNAVRLCFQVFLFHNGKYSRVLQPVVSDPIYDKKAMSDLNIIKLSDCVSYVDGGRKDIILLCEKVAKEDIQVRFYEVKDGVEVWEGYADFQPSQVHKQHAIWFRTPRYRTLDITEPVRVFIQLRRPSDGETSQSLPFEFLPLDSGRPPYWSYRRHLAKKGHFSIINEILANESKKQLEQVGEESVQQAQEGVVITDKPVVLNQEIPLANPDNSNIENWTFTDSKTMDEDILANNNNIEKSFNELINEVAELDEIYSENRLRYLESTADKPAISELHNNESFDDTRTYSSLQLAFKNPINIEFSKKYDSVVANSPSPISEVALTTKRDGDIEKLPPLPPKRAKKIETYIGNSLNSIHLTGEQAENLLHRSNSSLRAVSVSRSHSFNLQRPKSQAELSAPGKNLPPTPKNYSTLPNPKKRGGFFSKLFGRRSKTPSRETSAAPASKRNSFSSSKSLQVESTLGKSTSNISTHSATSIRIPLKDDSPTNSSENVNNQNSKEANVNSDDIDMNLDLTEAEHYALYTAMAPHATQSEFDEMSCYYAPVEGGKLLTNAEVLARLSSKT